MKRTKNGNKYFTEQEMIENDITDFVYKEGEEPRVIISELDDSFSLWDLEINHRKFRDVVNVKGQKAFEPFIPLVVHGRMYPEDGDIWKEV